MGEWIKALFVSIFGTHSGLATIFISMVPIVELRGAIPFGSAISLWGENALPLWASFGYSVLGSSFVCIIITFLFWHLFNFLKRTKGFKKLANAIENKLSKKSENINKKVEKEQNKNKGLWLKIFGVFAFVAVPLPLTGVWTGTCLALFIGLNKLQTLGSVLTGNLIAGLLMTMISYFFADNTMIVLYIFLILVAIFVVIGVIKSLVDRKKKKAASLAASQNLETSQIESQNSIQVETKNEK